MEKPNYEVEDPLFERYRSAEKNSPESAIIINELLSHFDPTSVDDVYRILAFYFRFEPGGSDEEVLREFFEKFIDSLGEDINLFGTQHSVVRKIILSHSENHRFVRSILQRLSISSLASISERFKEGPVHTLIQKERTRRQEEVSEARANIAQVVD